MRGWRSDGCSSDLRYEIALKVESAYHSGYEKPLELGGAEFLCVCLSYFGGWRGTAKRDFFARLGHTGDEEASNSYAERFEKIGRAHV